jgi:hypothetical protein
MAPPRKPPQSVEDAKATGLQSLKYKTNPYITIYNRLKIADHTENPLVMRLLVAARM